MSIRADAHVHFFQPGHAASLPDNCRRVQPDEITLYSALAQQHDIQQALIVGYEGEDWARGNNQYLIQLAAHHDWIQPLAFVQVFSDLNLADLNQCQHFIGLSYYCFDEAQMAGLNRVADQIWDWLVQQRWLISVNSRGAYWQAWMPILARHPDLRLLVSHLGLPPSQEHAPNKSLASEALRDILVLAQFPQVRVKLSGFYALTQPGYDYPHQASWPYVEALLSTFGAERLLWGSDFSPCLEWISFPQTFALFAKMPFLNNTDITGIEGGNLLKLLAEVR